LEQLGPIVVGQHQVEQHDVRVPLAHELQPAARRLHGADGIAFLSQPGGDGPRQAPVIFHQGALPLDGHADGILPWNLRRSEPRTATAEFAGRWYRSWARRDEMAAGPGSPAGNRPRPSRRRGRSGSGYAVDLVFLRLRHTASSHTAGWFERATSSV